MTSLVVLTSCTGKTYSYMDYRLEMEYKAGFSIMQLTDIHLGIQSDVNATEALLKEEIEQGSPNLIIFTGDTFMDATKSIVDSFFTFADSFDIPFAFTYGNHDAQGDYDKFYIPDRIMGCRNSMYIDYNDDDLFGQTNYYIDIVDNNYVKYRVYIIDSNSYYAPDGFTEKYDVIHEEQIAHIEDIAKNDTSYSVNSLAFFHIPLYEYDDAYKLYYDGTNYDTSMGFGKNREKVSYGYKRTDAFARMKAAGINSMFVGHDHINDSTLMYQDVILSYGVKSTREIYNEKYGYALISLDGTSRLKLSDISHVFLGEDK